MWIVGFMWRFFVVTTTQFTQDKKRRSLFLENMIGWKTLKKRTLQFFVCFSHRHNASFVVRQKPCVVCLLTWHPAVHTRNSWLFFSAQKSKFNLFRLWRRPNVIAKFEDFWVELEVCYPSENPTIYLIESKLNLSALASSLNQIIIRTRHLDDGRSTGDTADF
jgi:hypothetical protein